MLAYSGIGYVHMNTEQTKIMAWKSCPLQMDRQTAWYQTLNMTSLLLPCLDKPFRLFEVPIYLCPHNSLKVSQYLPRIIYNIPHIMTTCIPEAYIQGMDR